MCCVRSVDNYSPGRGMARNKITNNNLPTACVRGAQQWLWRATTFCVNVAWPDSRSWRSASGWVAAIYGNGWIYSESIPIDKVLLVWAKAHRKTLIALGERWHDLVRMCDGMYRAVCVLCCVCGHALDYFVNCVHFQEHKTRICHLLDGRFHSFMLFVRALVLRIDNQQMANKISISNVCTNVMAWLRVCVCARANIEHDATRPMEREIEKKSENWKDV